MQMMLFTCLDQICFHFAALNPNVTTSP